MSLRLGRPSTEADPGLSAIAPTPDFGFQPGDTAVVIGTPEGVKALAGLLG